MYRVFFELSGKGIEIYMEREFHKIVKKICKELDIKYSLLSKDWIIMLEKDNITKFISGFKFDLNGHALGNVVDDKYALYDVLKTKNIPIIEHMIMFRNSYNYEEALSYYNKYNKNIVVKSNTGTCGSDVYNIKNIEDLDKVIKELFKKNYSISLCPFYDIETEYRIIILDNNVMYSYGKKRPIVLGNGEKTVKELLIEFNNFYFSKPNAFSNSKIDIEYIPLKNEVIEYNWQFNLSKGAQIVPIEKEIKNIVEDIAIDVARKIDLKFSSIDIIKTKENEFYVIEANSGVMMENLINLLDDGYELAYTIYKKAIMSLFGMNSTPNSL